MEFMVPIAPLPSFTWDVAKDEKSQQNFEGGWLQQFFDSAFFCEWIAVTYLYKQDNEGVREYLCKRMYSLSEEGIQDYLFQLCYLAVHQTCPPLEKYLVDICKHNLHASLRMHWFLAAELADLGKDARILGLQASCLEAALLGTLPALKCPRPPKGPSSSQRVFQMVSVASRCLLPLSKQEQASTNVSADSQTENRRFVTLSATMSSSKTDLKQVEQEEAVEAHSNPGSILTGVAAAASSRLFISLTSTSSFKADQQIETSEQPSTGTASKSAAAAAAAAAASSAAAVALSGLPLKALVTGNNPKAAGQEGKDSTESALSRLKSFMPQGAKAISKKTEGEEQKSSQEACRTRSGLTPPVSPTYARGPAQGMRSEGPSPASSSCSTPVGCASPTRRQGPLFRAGSGAESDDVNSLTKTTSTERGSAESKDIFMRYFFRHDEQRLSSECLELSSEPDTPGSESQGSLHDSDFERKHPAEVSPTESSWMTMFKDKRSHADTAEADDRGPRESSIFWRFFRSRGEEGERDELERQRALVIGELGVLPEGDETEIMSCTSSEASYTSASRQASTTTSMLTEEDSEPGTQGKDSFLWRIFTGHRSTVSIDGSEAGSALTIEEDEEDEDQSDGFFRKLLHPRPSVGESQQAKLSACSTSAGHSRTASECQLEGPLSPGSLGRSFPPSPCPAMRPSGSAESNSHNAEDPQKHAAELKDALNSIEKTVFAGFLGGSPDGILGLSGGSNDLHHREAQTSTILPAVKDSGAGHKGEGLRVQEGNVAETPIIQEPTAQGPQAPNSTSDGLLKRFFRPDKEQEPKVPANIIRLSGAAGDVDPNEAAMSPRKGHERTSSLGSRLMSSEGGLFSKMFRGKGGEDPAKAAELLIAGVENTKIEQSGSTSEEVHGQVAEAGGGGGSLFRKFWSGKAQESTTNQTADHPTQGLIPVSKTVSHESQSVTAELRHTSSVRGVEGSWSLKVPKAPGGEHHAANGFSNQDDSKSRTTKEVPIGTADQHKRNKSSGEAVEAGKQVLSMLYRNTVVSAAGAASGAAGAAIGAAGAAAGAATSLVGGAARGLVQEGSSLVQGAASLVRGKPQPQQQQQQLQEEQVEKQQTGASGEVGKKAQEMSIATEIGVQKVDNGTTPEGGLLKKLYGSTLGTVSLAGASGGSQVNNTVAVAEDAMADASASDGNKVNKAPPRFIRRLFEEKDGKSIEEGARGDNKAADAVPHIPIPLVDAPAPVPVQPTKSSGYRITSIVGNTLFGSKTKPEEDMRCLEQELQAASILCSKGEMGFKTGPAPSETEHKDCSRLAEGTLQTQATSSGDQGNEARLMNTNNRIQADNINTAEANQNSATVHPEPTDAGPNAMKELHTELVLREGMKDHEKDMAAAADEPLPYSKPKLPKYPSFTIRTDTMCATLDFVKALGDISLGLVDVPHADRVRAMQESLSELNAHLAQMSNSEGVFWPLGKGLLRIVRIPEEEAVLMSSRERVPFMIFVEVLNCEPLASRKKEMKAAQTLAKSGIPLASGQTAPVLPRPPPWALHMWSNNKGGQGGPSGLNLSRTLSDLALDRAMASLYCRMKVVGVSMEVRKRPKQPKRLLSRRSVRECCTCIVDVAGSPGKSKDGSEMGGRQDSLRCRKCGLPTLDMMTGSSDALDDAASEAETEESGDGEELNSKGESKFEEYVSIKLVAVPGVTIDDVASVSLAERGEHRRVPSSLALAHVRESTALGQLPPLGVAMKNPPPSPRRGHPLDERIDDRKARIRKASKFGSSPDWDLKCVIVKSGDDCRQEHLALQLVSHFKDIFQEAGLPLWLRPYEILVTSSRTALIETITDSVSLHTLKGRYPQAQSLRDYFEIKHGAPGSPTFRTAQQNFVESMAAYSIVCYLLQVKDRHNGNILLDNEGHVIHIDFGFMLSNSPGGVNFENAPFKLTREMLEVMDSDAEGLPSEAFDYFKVLCIQGFLTCRKQSERILLLVEMMQRTRCPCFKAGTRVVHNLRKRFHLTLTEEQSVSMVLSLISKSVDSWRTRQYDYYQKVLNGIL